MTLVGTERKTGPRGGSSGDLEGTAEEDRDLVGVLRFYSPLRQRLRQADEVAGEDRFL